MQVVLVSPRGFCAGVMMAVDALQKVIEEIGPPVFVYHEIVHNKHVVERFQKLGATFVDSIENVPEGATLLFSAHGISPQVRAAASNRGLFTIDATCPLVTKVHAEVIKFASAGYDIIFIGHEGHDEVIGTMGEAPGRIRLVESVSDVDKLERISDKMAYLTQTTLSVDDAERIILRLRARFPGISGPPREDICYATQNRQNAVRALASPGDLVLVVGSQNSSNSIRLTEVACEQGIDSVLVEGPDTLPMERLGGYKRIVVTAGASAPDDLVWGVIARLKNQFGATFAEKVLQEERVHFVPPKELRGMIRLPAQH